MTEEKMIGQVPIDRFYGVFTPPTASLRLNPNEMLRFGLEVRDTVLHELPLLPSAIKLFQDMASGREWRLSGFAKGVARAVEYFNNSVSRNWDGTVEVGFEKMVDKHALDYNAVGRYAWTVRDDMYEYLDPCYLQWYASPQDYHWQYKLFKNDRYEPNEVRVINAISLGGRGLFMSPIYPVIPRATMAWLIDEHDRASADGRKIRDIYIVFGRTTMESLSQAITQSVLNWSGPDAREQRVPIAYVENVENVSSAKDLIHRLGLAEIPENFNRDDFQFLYVNEISAALGLSLRHFWNSEKATNRALEEVQEARQQQKGPTAFVRDYQRNINNSGILKQFGSNVRIGFVEEVDMQSQKTRAEVLKLWAEALQILKEQFPMIQPEKFIAWFQGEGLLPLDIDPSTMGTLATSDPAIEPVVEKDMLDYDEISMDLNGRILEKRSKIFTIQKAIRNEIIKNSEEYRELLDTKLKTFKEVVEELEVANG